MKRKGHESRLVVRDTSSHPRCVHSRTHFPASMLIIKLVPGALMEIIIQNAWNEASSGTPKQAFTDFSFSIVPDEEIYCYCLVQYYFKGGKEHPIERNRHGNSKRSQTEYVRTWESTKDFLEKASQGKSPREAVSHVVIKDLGGISSCLGFGQLPRNRQQSSDLKQNRNYGVNEEPNSKNISGKRRVDDPWYLLFNEAKRQSKDRKSAFICNVIVANEPLCVLATDRQLNDLKRFCCNETKFRPFSVDPTFDIRQFNVTPISYEHLLLETKRDGKHPTMIGPVCIVAPRLHHRSKQYNRTCFP